MIGVSGTGRGERVTATDAVGHPTLCAFAITTALVPDMDNDGAFDFDALLLSVDALMGLDTMPLHVARSDARCDGLAGDDEVQDFFVALNR